MLMRRACMLLAVLALALAAAAPAGAEYKMYGPTWDIAPLSTPSWSFDCRSSDSGAWSVGFIVRRDFHSGESWGYSYIGNGSAPAPFTMVGFPYKASANPGRVPTGYIMVTNWSFEQHNYTNIAVCDKPAAHADARSAAAGGTVRGREEDGTRFVYSTRVMTEREKGGTRHIFVTRPIRPRGGTDVRVMCPPRLRIVRAFSHVGFYTSRALNDGGEESERVRESHATLDERVRLHAGAARPTWSG